MNQTKKRLSIIKLAISITDIETIQLQILKLSPIQTDLKIQEILSLLQTQNYAKAQILIGEYIESEQDEILQRASQQEGSTVSQDDQEIIDEFKLFVTPVAQEKEKVIQIDINDFVSPEPKPTTVKENVNYESLLNMDAEDVLSDNIEIQKISFKTGGEEDDFFNEEKKEKVDIFDKKLLDKNDTFFDEEEKSTPTEEEEESITLLSEETLSKKEILQENTPQENTSIEETKDTKEKAAIQKATQSEEDESVKTEITTYSPITDILQKFIHMKYKYPLIQRNHEKFETVDAFLRKLEKEPYTEEEIEEMIQYIQQLIQKEQYTEAAQLLLISASTESLFAQFMLARELYKGSILTKNLEESFRLMHLLTLDEYPEALCDIGQFYEHGIGTDKNLKKAESSYEKAVNLGIKRAKKHYTRLHKNNKTLSE